MLLFMIEKADVESKQSHLLDKQFRTRLKTYFV